MFCFRKETSWPKDFVPVLILCGLDNAGKSTIVCRLCSDSSDPIPTVGFVPHTVKFGNKSIRLYDVGGGERIRGIWSSYFAEVYGVIYVIDSTDVRRLPETIEVYKSLCNDPYLCKKPILVLANKQDTNGALNGEQVESKLVADISRQNTFITETSGIQQGLDKNIKNGLMWMMKYITDNYHELSEKVNIDLAAIEEQRKKDKILRAERIRITKEERKKQETPDIKDEENNSDEDDMVCSPFKPIKQAFTNSNASIEIISSPEVPDNPEKKHKSKGKLKKKRKGNKVVPIHSNEGSQMSLQSDESIDPNGLISDNKLSPLNKMSSLPKIMPDFLGFDKSSLPPISSLERLETDNKNVSKTKLSDLVDQSSEENVANDSVTIPGIFQNKYVSVENIENKPVVNMESLHTIRIDRSKFIENVAM